jgi:glyoxylase-like metal-dependent hydrolase (beta-lactamase superfamily II)
VSTTPAPAADFELGLLDSHDIALVRAPNPGPLTLSGTNSWLIGRAPAFLIDPGPLLPAHLERLHAAIEERGGLGGIALTHDHRDHSESAAAVRAEHPAPLAAARGEADVLLADGARFGPLEAVFAPGHAPDHYCFIGAGVCFSGDAVLGEGSVVLSPEAGALRDYLSALARLSGREDFSPLCPGHGPVVRDGHAKLREYIEHRAERESRLKLALQEGRRSVEELLDSAWSDVPAVLRPAARATLAAHLDKLELEGELPAGVERPAVGRGEP